MNTKLQVSHYNVILKVYCSKPVLAEFLIYVKAFITWSTRCRG